MEAHFASLEEGKRDAKLKEGLFDLISNVLLIEAPGSAGAEFHFRLGMEQTASFRQLDQPTQARLKDLYVDYFYRRQDGCWRREALQKLPALKRVTNMLICGEDLGMVPACVPEVMKQLAPVGPGNSAHAQGLAHGFFAPGGRSLFERGHALDA